MHHRIVIARQIFSFFLTTMNQLNNTQVLSEMNAFIHKIRALYNLLLIFYLCYLILDLSYNSTIVSSLMRNMLDYRTNGTLSLTFNLKVP